MHPCAVHCAVPVCSGGGEEEEEEPEIYFCWIMQGGEGGERSQ